MPTHPRGEQPCPAEITLLLRADIRASARRSGRRHGADAALLSGLVSAVIALTCIDLTLLARAAHW